MNTTAGISSDNPFERLPDELLETIFYSLGDQLPLTPNNHVRLEDSNTYYFDYSLQQPLLKHTHADIFRLSQVCRRFHQIIHSLHFWEQKCRRDHVLLPCDRFPPEFNAYEELYVSNPFHPSFNFIETSRWTKSRGAQSRIEPTPYGSFRLYDEFNRSTPCRVTSYTFARFFQRDLRLAYPGLRSRNRAGLRPVIEFSICVAARWDCGSRCELSLLFSDGHSWSHHKAFPQWNDRKWHRITYRYAQYDHFPSSATVCIAGSDTQAWAGFYGIKFAQARLRLLLRTSDNATNIESVVAIEPRVEDELNQNPESEPEEDNLPIDVQPKKTQPDASEGNEEWADDDDDDDE